MKKNRCGKLATSVLLQHDNPRLHTGDETADAIAQPGFETITHPRCSLELAPSDYWLSEALKRHLAKGRYDDLNQLDAAVKERPEGVPKDFFVNGIENLPMLRDRCIQSYGDYFE